MYRPSLYSNGWLHSYTPADQEASGPVSFRGEKLIWLALRVLAGIASWQQKRRIKAELMALDDRELADIGLARSDIERVANGRYRDDRLAA